MIVWDKTGHVPNLLGSYFAYKATLIEVHKQIISIKLGKKTLDESLEDFRKRLITSMRLGSMYVLDCGALIPDFNS